MKTEKEILEIINKNSKKQLADMWLGFLLAMQRDGIELDKYLKQFEDL